MAPILGNPWAPGIRSQSHGLIGPEQLWESLGEQKHLLRIQFPGGENSSLLEHLKMKTEGDYAITANLTAKG